MARVLLIHGNGDSSGSDHWMPAVAADVRAAGFECLSPDFPQPQLAPASLWLPFIENELRADEDTVLVGHSSGAIAAMRYAESHRLGGSVLIGTYHTDLGMESERESGYFDTPWDWDSIRHNQPWVAVFASVDDPFISIDEARFVAENVGADYFEYQDRGHFMEPAFPELSAYLCRRLGTPVTTLKGATDV